MNPDACSIHWRAFFFATFIALFLLLSTPCGTDAARIDSGNQHTIALRGDGTVWSWGVNTLGPLGNNTYTDSVSPVQANGLTNVISVIAGHAYSLALKSDGTVWAWGDNTNGELGIGTGGAGVKSPVPVQVKGPGGSGFLTDVVAIAANADYYTNTYSSAFAIKSDGTVWAWGNNSFGQLGDGTGAERWTPVQVKDPAGTGYLTGIVAISSGLHTMALKSDGTVWTWGFNDCGQFGNVAPSAGATLPIQVKDSAGTGHLTGIVAIAAGRQHSMALHSDGTVWTWGLNADGQLGKGDLNGTTVCSENGSTAPAVPLPYHLGLTGVAAISAGYNKGMVIKNDGTVWAWGGNTNNNGQLGQNTTVGSPNPVQVQDSAGTGFLTGITEISAKSYQGLALKSDGTAWGWGYNAHGELGTTGGNKLLPVAVSGIAGFSGYAAAVAAGTDQTFALKRDGTVWGWGNNGDGRLGNGNSISSSTPVQATGASDVTAIATGVNHTVAVKSDGTVWGWGKNADGQLGYSIGSSTSAPAQVNGLSGITATAAGDGFSLALKSDGAVWAWGNNGRGQLGNNSTTSSSMPEPVRGVGGAPGSSLSGIKAIAAGSSHTVALTYEGQLRTWGYNYNGQLGNGNTTTSLAPVSLSISSKITAVAAGDAYTVALASDGTVWAWGDNTYGQLGSGGNTSTPRLVSGISDVTAIAVGFGHTVALKSDGTVWTWGNNGDWQLGRSGSTSTPTPIYGLSNVTAIAAGANHTVVLLADSSIMVWGRNSSGQLGNGTTTAASTPVLSLYNTYNITAAKSGTGTGTISSDTIRNDTLPTDFLNVIGASSTCVLNSCPGPSTNWSGTQAVTTGSMLTFSYTPASVYQDYTLSGRETTVTFSTKYDGTWDPDNSIISNRDITKGYDQGGVKLEFYNSGGTLLTTVDSGTLTGNGASQTVGVNNTGIWQTASITATTIPATAVKMRVVYYQTLEKEGWSGNYGMRFYQPKFTVTGAGGINCGSTCSVSYVSGTTITLTATPDSGSIFSGWSGACSGTGTCSVTISAAKNVTATFTQNPPTVTTISPSSGTTAGGTPITITGTNFTGAPGVTIGGNVATSVVVGSSTSITANTPAGTAGAKDVVVTTPGGSATGSGLFTYITFTYTVTYNGNSNSGGSVPSDATAYISGATVTVANSGALEKTGYTFAGWNTAANGGGTSYSSGATFSISGNTTLYAQWTALPTYALSITKTGTGTGGVTSVPIGIACDPTCSANFTSGTTVTLTATPAGGSAFGGWFGPCTVSTNSCTVTMDAAKQVYATFNAPTAGSVNALHFDGVDDYVDVSGKINLTNSFTIQTWLKPGALDGSRAIFQTGACGKNIASAALMIGPETSAVWNQQGVYSKLNFMFYDGIPYSQQSQDPLHRFYVSQQSTLPTNAWTHVAATYDITAKSLKLYVNGILENERSNTVGPIGASQYAYFGADPDVYCGIPARFQYNGLIREFSVWDRALSQTEIASSMGGTLTGGETGLKAYYPFNHGVAGGDNTSPPVSTLLDIKGGQNGTLYNFALNGSTSNWFFADPPSYTVSSSVSGSGGSISPLTRTVTYGTTTTFTLTPDAGKYAVVSGSCGGTRVGTTYTTSPITADCTVVATFASDNTPPSNGILTATAGNTLVALNWSGFSDSGTGITSYKLAWGTTLPSDCSSGSAIGNVISYTHSGLTNDQTYYYRVCAVDGAGYVSTGATASAVPTLTTGLVAWYPFNGSANDLSGNGHDGTVNGGATLTSDMFGNANSAYNLNGTDAYISASNVPVSQNLTVSAWVKSNTANWNNYGFIASSRDPGGFILHPNQGAKSWTGYIGNSGGSLSQIGTHTPSDITGFHHYAIKYDGSTAKMYFDGQPVVTTPLSITRVNSSISLNIGQDSARFGNAVIDDVRIYNRALSDAEIQSMVPPVLSVVKTGSGSGSIVSNTGGISCGATCTSSYTSGTTVTLTATPAGGSAFGGWFGPCSVSTNSCTVTMDAAKQVYAIFNAPTASSVNALRFDGVDDYVDASGRLTLSNSFTMQTWLKPGALDGTRAIFQDGACGRESAHVALTIGPNPFGWNQYGVNSRLNFVFQDGTAVNASTEPYHRFVVSQHSTLPTNAWTHVAATYDLASQSLKLYVNGILEDQLSNVAGPIGSTGLYAYLGADPYTYCDSVVRFKYEGLLREFSVWDRALSQAEIASSMGGSLTGGETGLKAYYPFNQGVAGGNNTSPPVNTLLDIKGGQNGTLYNFALNGSTSNWFFATYSVTYDGNGSTGGTAPTDSNRYLSNATVTVQSNSGSLLKTGYTFAGWNTAADGSGTSYAEASTLNIGSANIILYAQWSVNAPSGLISWWKGETNANNVAVDQTGANNGTFMNGTTTASGKVGQAFSLDGADDYVLLKNSAIVANSAASTVGAWVFPTAFNAGTMIYSENNSGGVVYQIFLSSAGIPTFGIWVSGEWSFASASSPIPTNAWTYITGTLDSSGMKIFVNGVGSGTNAANQPSNASIVEVDLGRVTNSGGAYFKGLIDEVQIYNRALSDAEILAIYNAGSNGVSTTTYSVTYNGNGSSGGSVPPDSGSYLPNSTVTVLGNTGTLVKAGYTFGGWNTAADGSGTSYAAAATFSMSATNVTLYAQWADLATGLLAWWRGENNVNDETGIYSGNFSGTPGYATGKVGQAFSLIGTDTNNSITAGNVPLAGKSFSFNVWVNRASAGRNALFFSQGTQATDRALQVGFTWDGAVIFNFYNDDMYVPTVSSDVGEWHQWSGSFNATTRERKLYKDGVLFSSNTATGTFNGSGQFIIGDAPWGNNKWDGKIDELQLYSRVLSLAEIQALYTVGSSGAPAISALTVSKSGSGSGTVTSDTGGVSCGVSCSAKYTTGATVTLTAAANSGSVFSGWTGACTGTGSCTVTMNAGKSVTASFTSFSIPGLVAYWKAENSANDETGNNNAGFTGPLYSTGVSGTAFSFDRNNYVRKDSPQNIPLSGTISFSAWLKYNSTDAGGINPEVITLGPVNNYPDGGGLHGIIILGNSREKIGIARGYGITPNFDCLASRNLGDNTWHHVVTTWDGTAISSVYIDGISSVQCTSAPSQLWGDYSHSNAYVSIGGRQAGLEDTTFSPFKGSVDEVMIFNRALSGTEVQQIYNGTLPPTVTSITPSSGTTAGGTPVTITGTNFTGATGVIIGGTAATSVVVVSATTITAITPTGTAGAKDLVVTKPGGSGTGTGLFTYVAPTYSVTYDGNGSTGGTVPTDSNSYQSNATLTVLSNSGSLVKTGYTFAGWNTAANGSGTTLLGDSTFSIGSANVTLYAQWSSGNKAYVTNYGSNTISVYTIDQTTGVLTAGTSAPTGTGPFSIAADPLGRFVYAANETSGTISVYSINQATGALTAGTPVAAGKAINSPSGLTVHPSGKFLYTVKATPNNTIGLYSIDQSTGGLTVGPEYTAGARIYSVAVDPSGRFLYAANADGNTISVFAISQSDGTLTAGATASGGGMNIPDFVTVDPSGRFVYVANYSAGISVFTINQTNGALTAGTPVAAGTQPFFIALAPSGKFAYVANQADNTISVFSIDQTTGALTAGTSVSSEASPTSVSVDPSGKFLFAANMAANKVSAYTIDQTTGALTALITGNPFAAGISPNSITTTTGAAKLPIAAPSGLVGWWKGEGNANDQLGINIGAVNGGTTYVTGKVGQAFSFDGTTGYITVPSSSSLDPTVAASMDAWVYFNQLPSAANHIMHIAGKSGSGTDLDLQAESDNKIHFYVAAGSSVTSVTTVQAGVWYHVAATYTANSQIKIYINGVLENTASISVMRGTNGYPFAIGASGYWPSRYFNGKIDEIRLFNSALTASQIQSIYNAGSNGVSTTTYTLSTSKSGSGAGTVTASPGAITWTGNSGSATYIGGTSVTLTASTDSGSIFSGWSGACTNTTGTCTVTMSAAKSVTATFTPIPIISITPPSPIDFDPVTVLVNLPTVVRINNIGSVPLNVNSITNGGSPDFSYNFAASGLAKPCGTTFPKTIAAGDYCEIQATFMPQSAGTKSCWLTINSDDPLNPSVIHTFNGTAIAPPLTPPGAPTAVAASAGNTMATVTFTAPASNGGSAITGYTVISNPAGGVDTSAGTTALSHVITGLTNGTAYTFTVNASNAIGTGTASSASSSVTPKALYPWYAYVPNRGVAPGYIQSYSVNQTTGVLSPLGTYNTDAAGDTDSIAVDPQGRFVYATNSTPKSVSAFKINQADGSLISAGTLTNVGTYPSYVTVDPAGKFAYVVDGSAAGTIFIYSIHQTTGALTQVNTASAGLYPYVIAIDPTGRFAYAAVSNSANVAMFTVNATTGALTNIGTIAVGQGAVTDSPVGVAIDPTGRYVYVADRGTGNDRIFMFSINQSTGVLTKIGTGIMPTGAGTTPLKVVVDPTGRYVYTANNSGKSVSMFRIDQPSGALTSIGANVSLGANAGPIELNINPAGTVLYVSDAGTPQGIVAFAINQGTGNLTPISGSPFATTYQPNGVGFGSYATLNGACGASNGGTFTATPSTNLCTAGTASSVTGSGPWSWTCAGINGGTQVTCSATPLYPLTLTNTGTGSGVVTSAPSGISCNATCSANYNSGSSVILTATPNTGSVFSGWSGACNNTTGTCTVTMSAAKSVTALFDPIPALSSGLVAWYPFTGNANDASGNANNGTVTGATLTTDRFGNANSAYNFDGVGAISTTSVNMDFAAPAFTISLWFKNAAGNYSTTAHSLINNNFSTTAGIGAFEVNFNDSPSPNRLSYWLGDTIGFIDPSTGVQGQKTNYTQDTWYHLVAVKSNNLYTFYVNGVVDATRTFTQSVSSTNGITLGKNVFGEYFNGAMDDVRIYNRALTQAEIETLYSKAGTISGRLTNSSSTGVQGVNVTVFATSGGGTLYGAGNFTTDANGNYAVSGLPAGDYKIQFNAQGAGYDNAWYSGRHDNLNADAVTLNGTNGAVADAVLTTENTFSISGRVTSNGSTGISGVWVSANDYYSGAYLFGTSTDANGNYSLNGFIAGSYKINFGGTSTYQRGWYNGTTTPSYSAAFAILITTANVTGINVTLAQTGAISGKVTSDGSTGIANVQVAAWDYLTNNWIGGTNTASDGTYTVYGLLAGDYKVFVDGSIKGYNRLFYGGISDAASATKVTVTGTATTINKDVTLAIAGSISGTVTRASDGTGIPSLTVTPFDAASGTSIANASVTTNSLGQYVINGLPAGSYKVLFSGGTEYIRQWYNNKTSKASGDAVTVTVGGTTSGINASLSVGGKITGTVTYVGNGVSVSVYDALTNSSVPGASSSIDANGVYTIYGLPTGNYKVRFNGNNTGYISQYYNGITTNNISSATPVSVTAGSTTSGINATLTIGGSISGTVYNATVGVRINAYDAVTGLEVGYGYNDVSGSGAYTIYGLPTGNYKVFFGPASATEISYAMQWYNNKTGNDMAGANVVAVTVGSATSGINATLVLGGKISGIVTNSNGTGISGISVNAYDATTNTFVNGIPTDTNGFYTISNLSAGSYKVLFATGNTGYLQQYYNNRTGGTISTADVVSVTAGSITSGINATLTAGGRISGTVTNGTTGISGVYVYAYDAVTNNYINGSSTTDSTGSYTIYGLPTGNYKIQFNGNNTGYASQYYNGITNNNISNAASVSVTVGSTTSGINANLALNGRITGTVTTNGTIGISGVSVSAYDAVTNYFISGGSTTDSTGTYIINGLPAGSYKVQFNTGNTGYISQFYNGKSGNNLTTADTVTVAAGGTTSSINATLTLGGSITGKVTSNGTSGISGVYITAYDAVTNSYVNGGFTIDSTGAYTIYGLPTGNYKVQFNGNNTGYVTQYYNGIIGNNISNATSVAVTAGNTTQGINATLAMGGSISGAIYNATVGVRINAYDAVTGLQVGSGYNDVNGNGAYTIYGLPAGNYKVFFAPAEATEISYAMQWYNNKTGNNKTGADIVAVTTGSSTSGINATLELGGKISGIVTNSNGTGISGVSVIAYDAATPNTLVKSIPTDANGFYTISTLPAGSYKVLFSTGSTGYLQQYYNNRTGGTISTADVVTVTAGSITTINTTLTLGGKISGTVVNSSGVAISGVSVRAYDAVTNSVVGTVATTGTTGSYTITGLSTGAYKVRFNVNGSGTGLYYSRRVSGDGLDLNHATSIAVSAPATVTGIDVTLPAAGAISGKVTNESGTAVSGVTVIPYFSVTDTEVWSMRSTTDASGNYTIGGLDPGSYKIQFSNTATLQGGYYNAKSSPFDTDQITVTANNTTTGIDGKLSAPTPTTLSFAGVEHMIQADGAEFDQFIIGINSYAATITGLTLKASGPSGFSYTFTNADIIRDATRTLVLLKRYPTNSVNGSTPAPLAAGTYTFTLTDALGNISTIADTHVTVTNTLPIVDSSTILYQGNADGSYHFSWTPVTGNYYYRVTLLLDDGFSSPVYTGTRSLSAFADIPAGVIISDKVYKVRVDVFDAPLFSQVTNRSYSALLTFSGSDSQTITFGSLAAKTYGDSPFGLTASASSGLAVSYTSSDPTVASISGATVTILKSGTTTITASQAGDVNYTAATSVDQVLTVNKADSAVSITGATSFIYSALPQGPDAASVTGSTGAISYSYAGTGATSYGPSATKPTAAGVYSVTAVVAADGNYNGASSSAIGFVINPANQSIVSVTGPSSVTFGTTGTATASGGSGAGSYIFSTGSSTGCKVTGNIISVLDASGTCTLTAIRVADTNYYVANASADYPVTLIKAAQSLLTVSGMPVAAQLYGATFTVAASGGSSSASPTFAATGACSVNATSGIVTMNSGSGICSVTATKAADSNHSSTTSAAATINAALASQATLLVTDMPVTAQLYGATFTVATSGGSGTGAVSYSATGSCSVDAKSGLATMTSGSGACSVTATKAADTNYNSTISAAAVNAALASQATLLVTGIPGTDQLYGATFTVGTSGGSSSASPTFTATGSCSVNATSGLVTMTSGSGACSVTAAKTADTNFSSTTSAAATVTAALTSQATLLVTDMPVAAQLYGATFTVGSSGGSGTGAVSYNATGACSVNTTSGFVTMTGGSGACSVTAAKAADTNFSSTTSAAVTVAAALASQATLLVTGMPVAAQLYGATFIVSTSGGSSTGAGSYSATGSCSVDATSGLVTMTNGTGACSVTATKTADTNFSSTTSAAATVAAALASQATLLVTGIPGTDQLYGTTFTVGTSGGSGTGAVSYSATGSCSVDAKSGLVTMTSGSGACSFTAAKAADTNYNSTISAATVNAALASQATLLVTGIPGTDQLYGATFTVSTSGGSGTGAISYSATGSCSVDAKSGLVTITSGSGACSVTAAKAADTNCSSTTSAAATINATLTSQATLLVTDIPVTAQLYGATFTVGTSGGSGTGAVSYSATGACSVNATSGFVTMTGGTGICSVTAAKAADTNYSNTTSAAATVNATLASQATLFVTGMPVTAQLYGATFTVGTSGGSGMGAVSYSATGSCSVDVKSGLVTMTSGTGICSITATKAADTNYSSTTSVAANVNAALPVTAPGAPTGVAAVAGNAQATITFTGPTLNGGSPITDYTVTSSPGGMTATGTSSPIVVSGLVNGTSYTFTVTAANSAGTGIASAASNNVTASAPPVVANGTTTTVTTNASGQNASTIALNTPGAAVNILAGTAMTDAAGNPVTGPLTMTATASTSVSSLPTAEMSGRTADGRSLRSMGGFIDINISSASGSVKRFATPITVNIALSTELAVPGVALEYFSFDGTRWNMEGTATVKADGTLDMKVSHLSIWAVAKFSSAPTGDINGDGKVDIADALKALQFAVAIGKPTSTELANGDVAPLVSPVTQSNGVISATSSPNGVIDIGDAIVILQKAIGIVTW